jgi:acyl-CoA reductase-like NAD-dependent aldehyde dehydrogenase
MIDKEDIIHMAQETGDWNGQTAEFNDVGLERFAELIAAHERNWCAKICAELRKMAIAEEREECAKVADAWQSAIHDPRYECDCADAIRNRGRNESLD